LEPYADLDYELRIDLTSRIWDIIPVPRRAYSLDGERLFEELKEHDAVKRCLEFMLREEFPKRLEMAIVDREGKPVANPDYRPFLFSKVLAPLAYEYIQEFGCIFSEQNFEKLFNKMMAYVYAEEWEVVAVAPLENFELVGAEEVSIDKYKIRRLSGWEMKQLIRMGHADSLGIVSKPTFGVIENVWCIEVSARAPKSILKLSKEVTFKLGGLVKEVMLKLGPDVFNNIFNTNIFNIDEFVTVMRLLKRGFVTSSVIFIYSKMEMRKWFPVISATLSLVRLRMYADHPKYTLNYNEIDSLSRLWGLYKRAKARLPRGLRIALRWFNKSYEESGVEDRVLDLAIAFEAMFSRRNYEVLAPRLITSDFNERKKIAEDLKELKSARDSIAHGGHGRFSKDKLEAIAANAEEIFRRCYRRFLELIAEGKSYNEIIDEVLYG